MALLPKIQHYAPKFLLKSIYYSIFELPSNLCLPNLGQIKNNSKKLQKQSKLQNMALCIIHSESILKPQRKRLHITSKCTPNKRLFSIAYLIVSYINLNR